MLGLHTKPQSPFSGGQAPKAHGDQTEPLPATAHQGGTRQTTSPVSRARRTPWGLLGLLVQLPTWDTGTCHPHQTAFPPRATRDRT